MIHQQVSFRDALFEAADLVGADCATDNPEYLRGVCGFMARKYAGLDQTESSLTVDLSHIGFQDKETK